MKKAFPLFFVLAVAIAPAFYLVKGGKDKKPTDGIVRKYKSKPVKKPVTVKLSDGIEYMVTSKGDGPKVQSGDRVSVLYKGMLTNDTVFDASYLHNNEPYTFSIGKRGVIAGWDSVIIHLHGGDKARMTLPPKYGYGQRAMGKIPANSTLIFEVEIMDIAPKPVMWDSKGKDTITTPSGLKIVMFEKHPENEMPKTGQMVSVHYSGYLTNGEMFDSSVERGQPYPFPLGRGQVIKGWDEGIALLHKGEKAQLIIPASLGYGDRGNGRIPGKATLIFDVQLVEIK
jgi:peptidylprolyl isomerase